MKVMSFGNAAPFSLVYKYLVLSKWPKTSSG